MKQSLLRKSKRLSNLLMLVGKYYLYHYKVHGSAKILRALLGHANEGLRVDRLSKSYLLIFIANSIVRDLINVIKVSLNDHVRYREFRVIYDRELWGPVDVARTINTYSSRLYASLTYFSTTKLPEYILLREMAKRVLRMAKRIYDDITNMRIKNGDMQIVKELMGRANSLERAIRNLRRLIIMLPRSNIEYSESELIYEVRRFLPYSPSWFVRAYNIYLLSKYLIKPMYVARRREVRVSKHDLVLLAWRLYEIFVYILLLSIFMENGYKVIKRKPRRLLPTKGNKRVVVLFNKPLEKSLIKDVNGDPHVAQAIRGKPDTSIVNGKVVVVECKFSGNPTYITAGRFKVMAYMYEYNADLGVLVFPDLDGRFVYDEEDRATSSLWDVMARNNGIAKITLSNGRSLYMVRADPAEGDELDEIWEGIKSRFLSVLKDEGLIT